MHKLLSVCTENIPTLVAVLVGTGMHLDEALHLMWTDIELQHRVIHVHAVALEPPKSARYVMPRSSTRCSRYCARWR